jgi:hypothetical protein
MFHCMVVKNILFMCATESDFGKRLPYAFLAEVCSITCCGDITQHVNSHVHVVVQYVVLLELCVCCCFRCKMHFLPTT